MSSIRHIPVAPPEYFQLEETHYKRGTSTQVACVLEQARRERVRVRVFYGDAATGRAWGDDSECGYVGRSAGRVRVALIVHNSRSLGGPAILTDCVVKIETTRGHRVLYQHPNYHSNQ